MQKAFACVVLAFAALLSGAAKAQIIKLPAVAMTVADCRAGDEWRTVNGISKCQPKQPPDTCENHGLYSTNQGSGSTFVPGVGTCYYPYSPPPPACQYGPTVSNNSVALIGYNCSADGGCSGSQLIVYWNSQWVFGRLFDTLTDDPATEPQVAAALAGSGYSRGILKAAGGSNGNTSNSYYWQVCH